MKNNLLNAFAILVGILLAPTIVSSQELSHNDILNSQIQKYRENGGIPSHTSEGIWVSDFEEIGSLLSEQREWVHTNQKLRNLFTDYLSGEIERYYTSRNERNEILDWMDSFKLGQYNSSSCYSRGGHLISPNRKLDDRRDAGYIFNGENENMSQYYGQYPYSRCYLDVEKLVSGTCVVNFKYSGSGDTLTCLIQGTKDDNVYTFYTEIRPESGENEKYLPNEPLYPGDLVAFRGWLYLDSYSNYLNVQATTNIILLEEEFITKNLNIIDAYDGKDYNESPESAKSFVLKYYFRDNVPVFVGPDSTKAPSTPILIDNYADLDGFKNFLEQNNN